MKQLFITIIGLLTSICSFGQVINLQGGASFSHIDWALGNGIVDNTYNQTSTGYAAFIGLDYLDKTYYNLSSNIGMLSKGGKGNIEILDENGFETGNVRETSAQLNYISVNTLIDIKYPVTDKLMPFVSIGPRFDYLINSSDDIDLFKSLDELNKGIVGLVLGGGVKVDLEKLQIGVRADYYLNFNKISEWPASAGRISGSVSDKTFTTSLILGYKF